METEPTMGAPVPSRFLARVIDRIRPHAQLVKRTGIGAAPHVQVRAAACEEQQ
jgi:hypothetical protein